MPFSRYLDGAFLNHVFGKSTFNAPANIYVGLSTTTPDNDGNNVSEPTGNGYARVSTASTDWNAATVSGIRYITNANPVIFPAATSDWASGANMVVAVLYDASSGGNFLGWGTLDFSKAVPVNNKPQFNAGAVYIQQGT